MFTPWVRLIGTWDGQALTVTRPVRPAAPPAGPPPVVCYASDNQSTLVALQHHIGNDYAALKQRGIVVLTSTPCRGKLQLVVAVADRSTVSYLENHYGWLDIVGWLQPF